MKKILFLTGTRADYGKLKSLMKNVNQHADFELHIFITGMHLLSKYGSTYKEIEKDGFKNLYKYVNQSKNTRMDISLSNTLVGLSNYVAELEPDLIVIHGDRLEALAGAIIGAFNNIKVAHIEGGEVSGTIDESIRHAITKFSHLHFVSTKEAKNRVMQLGEREELIYIIGSPDIDIMRSEELPNLRDVKKRYDIKFTSFALASYHPVTTEIDNLKRNIKNFLRAIELSKHNYVIIYPNNDLGTDTIIYEIEKFKKYKNIRVFPSIRFECFLVLLKHADFIIGNSSAGVREAGIYGVPAIDIGSRQSGRYDKNIAKHIFHTNDDCNEILNAIKKAKKKSFTAKLDFGSGDSASQFIKIISQPRIWESSFQKTFIDKN